MAPERQAISCRFRYDTRRFHLRLRGACSVSARGVCGVYRTARQSDPRMALVDAGPWGMDREPIRSDTGAAQYSPPSVGCLDRVLMGTDMPFTSGSKGI